MTLPNYAPWLGADRKERGSYQGLRMKTDTHLHEQLAAWVEELVPTGGKARHTVVDLGCGEGALSQRLHDLGYDVIAVDVDAAAFGAEGPNFEALDLNDRDAVDRWIASRDNHPPELVLAVEVIEHLPCPWDFLAACRKLCGPDTRLVLTTPNVGSWWSRLWFFLTGELWGFNPESWDDPGHIHAITVTEMQGMLRDNGLRCLDIRPAGCLPIVWAYNWKRLIVSLALLPLRPLMRGYKDGWVLGFCAGIEDQVPS